MCVLSCVWLFATPWTVACQAPLPMGFPREEYWSGLPFKLVVVSFSRGSSWPRDRTWLSCIGSVNSLKLSHLGNPHAPPWLLSISQRIGTTIKLNKKFLQIFHMILSKWYQGFLGSSVDKESTCNAGDPRFNSWVGKISWRRDRLPTSVFLIFPCGSAGKESAWNARRSEFNSWVGKIPLEKGKAAHSSILV